MQVKGEVHMTNPPVESDGPLVNTGQPSISFGFLLIEVRLVFDYLICENHQSHAIPKARFRVLCSNLEVRRCDTKVTVDAGPEGCSTDFGSSNS